MTTRERKRVLLYFGQDGCPYCAQLMKVNFSQPDIVATTRADFVAIALNIWGDREVTWADGRTMSEKKKSSATCKGLEIQKLKSGGYRKKAAQRSQAIAVMIAGTLP